MVNALKQAVDRLAELEDPAAQAEGAGALLASWPDEQKRLRRIRQSAVKRMRDTMSYRKIAARLGISVARVQQIEAGETGRDGRTRKAEESGEE